MDAFATTVRQIWQYGRNTSPGPGILLLAQAGMAGAYQSIDIGDLFQAALRSNQPASVSGLFSAGALNLPLDGTITWGTDPTTTQVYWPNIVGGLLGFSTAAGWRFDYANAYRAFNLANLTPDGTFELPRGQVRLGRPPALPEEAVSLGYLKEFGVTSINGRHGDVWLSAEDITSFLGICPPDQVASQTWVNAAICKALEQWYYVTPLVFTFNGRVGDIFLTTEDVNAAYANGAARGAWPTAPTPALGDASNRIATTLFTDGSLEDLHDTISSEIDAEIANALTNEFAPINSPNFTGIPTGPTANPGTTTGQLATTAFVMNAVAASVTGVASWNTRTGNVTMTLIDITSVGGAPIASPVFTGVPQGPTPALHDNSTKLATTAYVENELAAIPAAGVLSFNTRTGAVVLTTADITTAGGAPTLSPALTGTPTAPTAAPATNNTTIATTAFVQAAIAGLAGAVTSFNSRTGAITLLAADVSAAGGALVASPTFTGTPAAPTAIPGTNNTQLATTAFVVTAINSIAAGVTSFNTRTGTVTLTSGDINSAGGALLAGPAFTGVPTAPTAAQASNDTTLATTAFVHAAVAAAPSVTSFNTRTGAVTLNSSDVSAAGGALIASPTFTGTPAAPTATVGTNTTQLATTAFVMAQLATAGGVTSFNGRAGVVTLTLADITGAGGAAASTVIPQCGRLYLNATPNQVVTFTPYNGNQIKINGAIYSFAPTTAQANNLYLNGVASSSLAANTVYYVYAFWNGSQVTLDFSTTGHSTSTTAGNAGVEIKTGDDTRTLVGIVYTQSSAPSSNSFADSSVYRGVRSWFNRAYTVLQANGTNSTLTSTTPVIIATVQFVCFVNELMHTTVVATVTAGATAFNGASGINWDGSAATNVNNQCWASATTTFPLVMTTNYLNEGKHVLAATGQVSASQANWTSLLVATVG